MINFQGPVIFAQRHLGQFEKMQQTNIIRIDERGQRNKPRQIQRNRESITYNFNQAWNYSRNSLWLKVEALCDWTRFIFWGVVFFLPAAPCKVISKARPWKREEEKGDSVLEVTKWSGLYKLCKQSNFFPPRRTSWVQIISACSEHGKEGWRAINSWTLPAFFPWLLKFNLRFPPCLWSLRKEGKCVFN